MGQNNSISEETKKQTTKEEPVAVSKEIKQILPPPLEVPVSKEIKQILPTPLEIPVLRSASELQTTDEERLGLWILLPRDIKRLIFFYFSLKELIRFGSVSKAWYNDVCLGIQKLNFRPFYLKISEASLNRILSNCEYISKINLSFCSQISLSTIKIICESKYAHKVTHLDVTNCNFDDKSMESVCKYLVQLEDLQLSRSKITDASRYELANLTNLKSLDLSYANINLPRWGETLLKLTNLEVLSLDGLGVQFSLVSSLTKLKHLDARCTTAGDYDSLKSLVNLETLMLGWSIIPVNWDVLKALPKLSYLKLHSKIFGSYKGAKNFNDGRLVKCEINSFS